jgi:hypothetical protein
VDVEAVPNSVPEIWADTGGFQAKTVEAGLAGYQTTNRVWRRHDEVLGPHLLAQTWCSLG